MSNSSSRRGGQMVEWVVGVFLLLAFATLLVLAFATTNGNLGLGGGSYQLIAKFSNVGDLRSHAPVKIGGVVVGEVAKISLDRKNYSAVVTLALDPTYKNLPADTSAKILTAGLLGERYIGLDPGGDPETLPSGGEIVYTQSAVVLEDLISKFVFGAGGKKPGAATSDAPPAGTPSDPTQSDSQTDIPQAKRP